MKAENDFFFKYRKNAMERLPKPEHSEEEDQIPGSNRKILLKA